jgi:hypothetical protein
MRVLASYGTTVSFYHQRWQPKAGIDILVSLTHFLVALVQTGFIDVKAVKVFHDKLTDPQQATAGTGFVTKLGLYLIGPQRKIPVALHIAVGKVGDDFFVGRPERQRMFLAVG